MGQPNFPQTPPVSDGINLLPSHTTIAQTLFTAPAGNGVMVGRIRACSTDTAPITLQFSRVIGAKTLIIGESQVPAGAGTDGSTAWKDILDDINVGEAMTLKAEEVLKVAAKTTITSAKQIDIHLEGAPL